MAVFSHLYLISHWMWAIQWNSVTTVRKLCAAEPIPEGIIEEGYSLSTLPAAGPTSSLKEYLGVYLHVHNKHELSCTTGVLSIATTTLKNNLELSNRVVDVHILKFSYSPSKYIRFSNFRVCQNHLKTLCKEISELQIQNF